ncbi:MAG: TonB family protein [Nitrococcus sp.]|nr:TonB family protein [Nitrococcus sp.]
MTEGVPWGARVDVESLGRIVLVPIWLRPIVAMVIAGIHIGALVTFAWLTPEKATPMPGIEIQVIPYGESVTHTASIPTPDAAPVVTPGPAQLASSQTKEDEQVKPEEVDKPSEQPARPAELAAPPPKVVAEEAPVIAIEKEPTAPAKQEFTARAVKKPKVTDSRPSKSEHKAALQARERVKQQLHASLYAAQAQRGAPAIRAGLREGSKQASRMARLSYAALVSAELNRHKIYPASARDAGASGNVAVVLTVGPSGDIIAHRITRSSGNAAIDAAVHTMMTLAQPPPPPGGRFVGSVVIRFQLGE